MDFEPWLHAQGYAPATIKSTVRLTRRAFEVFHEGGDVEPYADVLRRLSAWAHEHPPAAPTTFVIRMAQRFSPLSAPRQSNALEGIATLRGVSRPAPETLTIEQWGALLSELDTASHKKEEKVRAKTLQILLAFPYPARDLKQNLHENLTELSRRVAPDAASSAQGLKRAGHKTLATYLQQPQGRVAYDMLRNYLSTLGHRIGREHLTFSDIERTSWNIRARSVFPPADRKN